MREYRRLLSPPALHAKKLQRGGKEEQNIDVCWYESYMTSFPFCFGEKTIILCRKLLIILSTFRSYQKLILKRKFKASVK